MVSVLWTEVLLSICEMYSGEIYRLNNGRFSWSELYICQGNAVPLVSDLQSSFTNSFLTKCSSVCLIVVSPNELDKMVQVLLYW